MSTNPTTAISNFIKRRGKLMALLAALLTVIFLVALLSSYMLSDVTSNYQSSSTTPDESNTTIQNQGKIIYPNQESSNSPNSSGTTVFNAGVLKTFGVGVYWDSGLTSKANTTDWGIMHPGAQKSFTLYVRNEKNSSATLSLSTSNWIPSTASAYLALTWNYNGQTISPSAQMQVTLTLTTSSNITEISNFNFDIIIAANS